MIGEHRLQIFKTSPNKPGMLPDHSQTLLVHFWEKTVLTKNDNCVEKLFSNKKQPHMAHLAKVPEAKCSKFDQPFFIFSPQPSLNLSFPFSIPTV